MESIKIQKLINDISPLYNFYKKSNRTINGTKALEIMWDIGDYLKIEIENSNIPPHNLYRKIYGKAEGQYNITQKSYITREFLGRTYRIRNIFKNKQDIKKTLPNLKNFICFREAMPFFDNKKYLLKGKDRELLLSILNSNESPSLILKKIKLMQDEKIGKKNPRNQKLGELEKEKLIFISFYNYIYKLIKESESFDHLKEKILIDNNIVTILSSITDCLTEEGMRYQDIPKYNFDIHWIEYVNLLERLITQKDPKERRRFRRLIPPIRIAKLAEMLQAIPSKLSFDRFKDLN